MDSAPEKIEKLLSDEEQDEEEDEEEDKDKFGNLLNSMLIMEGMWLTILYRRSITGCEIQKRCQSMNVWN